MKLCTEKGYIFYTYIVSQQRVCLKLSLMHTYNLITLMKLRQEDFKFKAILSSSA